MVDKTQKYGDSWITSCNSDVTQVIKSVCENKTNCIILANTQSLNVPDPCPFISKYVQVRYSCEKIGEIWYYFVAYSVFVAILLQRKLPTYWRLKFSKLNVFITREICCRLSFDSQSHFSMENCLFKASSIGDIIVNSEQRLTSLCLEPHKYFYWKKGFFSYHFFYINLQTKISSK